jgi:hypothetical protein
LIESHRKAIESETGVMYPKIRRYRLADENGNIIDLKSNYNFITKFARGAATVIIKEKPQIIKDSAGLIKAQENKKEGLIDTDGKELLPCIFDSVSVKLDGFVELEKDGVKKATNVGMIMSGDFDWNKTNDWD